MATKPASPKALSLHLGLNAVDPGGFAVGLIPHTLAVTTLGERVVGDALNLEVDLLFFDTTSTYFERDTEDTTEDGQAGFRRYGHSKDHRKDLPQIVIGLAVTREIVEAHGGTISCEAREPRGTRFSIVLPRAG